MIDMADLKINSLIKFYTLVLLNKNLKHGYEIIKELEIMFGRRISAAHVYPFLNLLEKNKIITHKNVEARDKKKYFFTQKGEKFMEDLMTRCDNLVESLITSKVKKCANCNCEIYKNGFEKSVKGKKLVYCCKHCAKG